MPLQPPFDTRVKLTKPVNSNDLFVFGKARVDMAAARSYVSKLLQGIGPEQNSIREFNRLLHAEFPMLHSQYDQDNSDDISELTSYAVQCM